MQFKLFILIFYMFTSGILDEEVSSRIVKESRNEHQRGDMNMSGRTDEYSRVNLSTARYEDIIDHQYHHHVVSNSSECIDDDNNNNRRSRDGEMCSVCLVEFEREDIVSQVWSCGHIFHVECIQGWTDRNHFTCPLCRSFLFNV